ncbi:hypothetical protein EV360DRAFT_74851 [Lentinula raphanica]|nr:hypothetical protein EV360DRAFT_74851 [Lentinula raphanica]
MGLVTSVLAAPTSTAAGPGLVQPAAVKSGLVSPSITQRFPRHPPHCPLAKVQKRNPGSSDPGSTVDYDPESKFSKFSNSLVRGAVGGSPMTRLNFCIEKNVYDSELRADKFFPYLLTKDRKDFECMCSIVKTNVNDSELPEAVKEVALNRIQAYKTDDTELAKEAVVWWLDFTLFGSQYADAANYNYKTPGAIMYDDYKIVDDHMKYPSQIELDEEEGKGKGKGKAYY